VVNHVVNHSGRYHVQPSVILSLNRGLIPGPIVPMARNYQGLSRFG